LREGPLETLDRTRGVFVKSLLDGIGKADAGAEFYFAAVSAERKGYDLSSHDKGLLNMFSSVIQKQEDEDKWAPQKHTNISEQQMGFEIDYTAGMELADNPSMNPDRVVPPNADDLKYSGRPFTLINGEANDPYRTRNALGQGFNPLHGNYHQILADFYLANEAGSEPQSQKDARKELAWEEHAAKNDHSFLQTPLHLGELNEDATNHQLYLNHYKRWEESNRDIVDKVRADRKEQGLSEAEIDHELKQIHMEDAKRDWQQNLGFMDYFLGMEWFSPEEREKAYRHLYDYGGADSTRLLTFDSSPQIQDFLPRLKRNFQQRFSGLYDWWTRVPKHSQHPLAIKPKRLPEDTENIQRVHNWIAMQDSSLGKKRDWERAVDHYNKMYRMYNPDADAFSYSHVPYFDDKRNEIHWRKQSIGKGNKQNYLSEPMLRHMLNIDSEGKLLEDGEHPVWGPAWKKADSPFSQEELDEIMKKRRDESIKMRAAGRVAKNHGVINYGTYMDPDHYDYLDDHDTLATHWKRPFQVGGMGKKANELFNLLHHHTLAYKPVETEQSADSQALRERFGDYLQDIGADGEQVGEFEPTTERTMMGDKEVSLFFEKTGNRIGIQHIEGGGKSMDAFFGPFGQGGLNLFPDAEGKTTAFRGDFARPSSLMNPQSAVASSGIKGAGGQNAHTERHSSGTDGKYSNEVHSDYHAARESGDDDAAKDAHDKLRGETPDHLRMVNIHQGTFNNDEVEQSAAYSYHTIGTMVGMGNNPMEPLRRVISHKNPGLLQEGTGLRSTLADHNDLVNDLSAKFETLGEFDIEEEKQQIEDSIENSRSRIERELENLNQRKAPTNLTEEELIEFNRVLSTEKNLLMGELQELPKAKERMIADLDDKLRQHTIGNQVLGPDGQPVDIGMMTNLGIPRELNPEGQVSRRLSASQRPMAAEEESQYFEGLMDRAGEIEELLESGSLTQGERLTLQGELNQLDDQMKEWERRNYKLTPSGNISTKHFGGKGHHNTLQRKLDADIKAIADAGEHLYRMLGQTPEGRAQLAQIFNPNADHETAAANMRMWAAMSNDFLQKAPEDSHDIMTLGNTKFEVKGQSKPTTDFATGMKTTISNFGNAINAKNVFNYVSILDGISQIKSSARMQTDPEQAQAMIERGEMDNRQYEDSFMDSLGLDKSDNRLRQTVKDYVDNTLLPRLNENKPMPSVMTGRQLFSQMYPDIDIDAMLANMLNRKQVNSPDVKDFVRKVGQIYNTLGRKAEERNRQTGIGFQLAHSLDDRFEEGLHTSRSKFSRDLKGRGKADAKNLDDQQNAIQTLNSLITNFSDVEVPQEITQTKSGLGRVKVGPNGHDTHTVKSLYNSGGFKHEFGDDFSPNFNYYIGSDGTPKITMVNPNEDNTQALVPLTSHFWDKMISVAAPAWQSLLYGPEHQGARQSLAINERRAPQFTVDNLGRTLNQDSSSTTKSDIGLADLTNPDIIRKDLGPEVPTLQPMHRIFELDDLEHLRGFTGDWIVSVMPEGERGFVKKDDDEVTSPTFDLSDEDKENFKKVTDEDYHADVIKTEDGYYIFDILEYEDKEVHEITIDDRIKILRGAMEGVGNVHLPSASDTRLTDDAGLKLAVDDLQKDHGSVLLRDAKSTYMAGELRHPKWVMLKPGKDVVLRVLDRRGNGPYTYRLGTGPITQAEKIGNRAVESEGETYMDVGVAFNSPEKYNKGDHVRVNAANVSKVESVDEETVYTLTGSEIIGEAEGEGLVSRETLGLLAKSLDSQWLCEVHRAKSGIRVVMPQGDVVYKATESQGHWSVHSPLSSNSYLVRLSESQRAYWSPIAGALLKANLDIAESDNEDKAEVHESQGDGKPLISPKKIKDSEWKDREKQMVMVKGLQLIEKLLKSGVGAVGQSSTGTMGLGIGYATPIESPMGPTNLHDEKTMPDYDNKKRPGEDSSIEPETEDQEDKKHLVIPVSDGVLEVDSDKAVFHT